jgi:hypothetical protein
VKRALKGEKKHDHSKLNKPLRKEKRRLELVK